MLPQNFLVYRASTDPKDEEIPQKLVNFTALFILGGVSKIWLPFAEAMCLLFSLVGFKKNLSLLEVVFFQGSSPNGSMAVVQSPVPLVNIKIDGTWVFIRPKLEAEAMTLGHIRRFVNCTGGRCLVFLGVCFLGYVISFVGPVHFSWGLQVFLLFGILGCRRGLQKAVSCSPTAKAGR